MKDELKELVSKRAKELLSWSDCRFSINDIFANIMIEYCYLKLDVLDVYEIIADIVSEQDIYLINKILKELNGQ